MRNINILKTKEENYTICVDNVYLHSKYYPLRAAQKFIKANEKIYKHKKYVLIYGIGMGYHLKILLENIDKDCKVYAFDVDSEVMNKCKDFKIFKQIKDDNRVEMFLGYNEKFFNALCEKIKLVEDIIIYKPSLEVLPSKYSKIKNLFHSYDLAKIGMQKFGQIANDNYEANIKLKPRTLKDFLNKYNFNDKPVVIASGGPSLEDGFKILKKYRDKFYIFALGRTIDILMKHNIKPDNITIIDPQEIVCRQTCSYNNSGIPLLFLSTASKDAVAKYNSEKYIFFNSEDENNKDNIIINTGKTVAAAALDIALKSGAKKIIFTGQDLAFLDNKFHAGDNTKDIEKSNGLKKVMGVNKEMLYTTLGMLEFKRNIERIIEENPNIDFINCSRGAKIKGTKEEKMNYIMDCLLKNPHDL